jgi:hypothetical protein
MRPDMRNGGVMGLANGIRGHGLLRFVLNFEGTITLYFKESG